MGLADRWQESKREQLLASLGPARAGITLFNKNDYTLAQVEAFVEKCRDAGLLADYLEFGRLWNAEYRVYAREPDSKDPRLPGEPGFLPLGDLRKTDPEFQAHLPPGYHQPLEDAERAERVLGESSGAEFTPFDRTLIEIDEQWMSIFLAAQEIEEPNRVVLASASAGAAVALGGFGTYVRSTLYDRPLNLPTGNPSGAEIPNRPAQFARALDHGHAIEAAYRVVTWALVAELACRFWRPNYEYELDECASVFESRNDYEATVIHHGIPIDDASNHDQAAMRQYHLGRWSLFAMVGASLNEEVLPGKAFGVDQLLDHWIQQLFVEGARTAGLRLQQLAPNGLPIWE